MASLPDIMEALRRADAEGNTEDAKRLAKMARDLQREEGVPGERMAPSAVNAAVRAIERAKIAGEPEVGSREGAMRSAFQGVTFGAGDEAVAALAAAVDPLVKDGNRGTFRQRYDAYLDNERRKVDQFREESPVTAFVTEAAGAVPTALMPLGALGRAAQGTSALARSGAGAAIGAGQGGVYGFLAGEDGLENRAKSAGVGAAVGGGLGAAAPVVGEAVRRGVRSAARSGAVREMTRNAPTTEQLRAQANRLFDFAGDGIRPTPAAFQVVVSNMSKWAAKEGIDPTLHPKATAALGRLISAADDPSQTTSLETLRRILGTAARSAEPDEGRIASGLMDKLDDFVDNLDAKDIVDGTPEVGAALKEARTLWGRFRRSELIDDAFSRAGLQASGVENGLRTRFRQILNNQRLRRGFSEEELAAMRKVVEGTATSNTLKRLSRLSFGAGQQSGFLGGSIGSGAGAAIGSAVGGPVGAAVGAVVPPSVGYAAQRGGQAITSRNARLAQALIASGGLPALPPPNPSTGLFAERLFQRNTPLVGPIADRVMSQ